MTYLVLIFESTHKVLKAEKLMIASGVKFDIIPTPKEFSSDCGMSIRINPDVVDWLKISRILEENGINYLKHEKISS